MGNSSIGNEHGIALVVAIVAMVVIGGFVAGTTFLSMVEERTSTNTTATAQAFQAAESGLQEAIGNWQTSWNTVAIGTQTAAARVDSYGGSYADRQVARLSDNLFLVMSFGTRGTATQSLAALLRLMTPDVEVSAAVTAGGDVRIGGNATVRGEETSPADWGCTPGATRIGIRASGDVQPHGESHSLSGLPEWQEFDTTVTASLFQAPFDWLEQHASIVLTGGQYSGMAPSTTGSSARCDVAEENNWGEPWRSPAGGAIGECAAYAPIILVNGNLEIQNGRGQGILLVDGDLEIRGGLEFTGLVIVTGEVKTNGRGSRITGGVLAKQVSLADESSFAGTPTVAFSACAIAYVLRASAVALPVPGRSFAYLYN